MHISKNLLLGLGLAGFIMESVVIQPALAADKVSLFKVITAKDEIVIGIADDELAQLDGKNAGGIAKMLVAKGSMSVWQYAVHKSASRRPRTGAAAQNRPASPPTRFASNPMRRR